MAVRVERAGAEGIDLPLRVDGEQALRVRDLTVALTLDDGRPARLAIELAVDFAVYRTIDEAALFHLEAEARGQSFGALDPAVPVELELELASALVARLAGDGVDSAALAAATLMRLAGEADAGEPILAAGSWYAIRVAQARGGGLKTGYATRWANAGTLG